MWRETELRCGLRAKMVQPGQNGQPVPAGLAHGIPPFDYHRNGSVCRADDEGWRSNIRRLHFAEQSDTFHMVQEQFLTSDLFIQAGLDGETLKARKQKAEGKVRNHRLVSKEVEHYLVWLSDVAIQQQEMSAHQSHRMAWYDDSSRSHWQGSSRHTLWGNGTV